MRNGIISNLVYFQWVTMIPLYYKNRPYRFQPLYFQGVNPYCNTVTLGERGILFFKNPKKTGCISKGNAVTVSFIIT